MCQTSVMLTKGGDEELLLENVTALEVLEDGLKITSLFDGTRTINGVAISRIDFNDGKVFLKETR
ncbi:CooT family nickel-binding protein [Desulforhopalus singaporensis]|uniref:Predicted RNA-binding protein n=1 Tax=Desulforhopalus singaporensis TaxID=91360 RepID=A0A1H0TP24_9BACT|nr:CooT family nickel-binding protein [Desulforhopalus singaporensis]SDP55802.1 Predicted RNA-binding protein [Desulforhopalus singaporensis]